MRRRAGFSLVEALVAAALLGLLSSLVARLYISLVRYQKQVACVAVQTQAGRAAMQWIADDLRLAGLNGNPEGDPNRSTEAIEGMWSTAIALYRDEVAAWALGNVPAGGEPLLDWAVPIRDAQRGARPGPFTLYRMTLRPDGTGMTRQPVIDDIGSLRFTYQDQDGNAMAPAGGGETPAARAARSAVAAVGVELTVSSPECPAGGGSNTLKTLVRPRNSGLTGTIEAP
jgi:type II secretory pathway pseudopilin PulG